MKVTKLIRVFMYALGVLLFLLGMFVYFVSREIPLPSNAKKVGDMIHIDISEVATDESEKAQASFTVPERYMPKVSEGGFAFYMKYPDATPYSGNESPVPFDSVRVVIRHYAKASSLPSESLLRKTQARDGLLKNVPYFVVNKNGMEIYQYDYGSDRKTIGTYFKFAAADGSKLIADDPGDWSHVYTIDRKLNSHMELIYLFPKTLIRNSEHFKEDIIAADTIILKVVQSFQFK